MSAAAPKETTIALLVAAGKSERMQSDTPKPYLTLDGQSILRRTVKNMLAHPKIDGVRVVIRRKHHAHYKRCVTDLTLFPPVIGGDTRQESVYRGLKSVLHRHPVTILVHDIARPLTPHHVIDDVLEGLKKHEAVIPALAITDTIKRTSNGMAIETVGRENLYTVQTPQGFRYDALLAAHEKFVGEAYTDDAALIEAFGGQVALVEGSPDNIKLTTQAELARMQTIIEQSMETRIGMGFDVHAFCDHDKDTPEHRRAVKLCGIRIPFEQRLAGHSDADVGLHAVVDAIFGALGDGDIGMHFPPHDQKWKGADSERFLMYAYEQVVARKGAVVHLDVTLICEKPHVSPHRAAMKQHIAQLLKLPEHRISVKATTTEKLGFTGRGEGIAAQAVATLSLPKVPDND